MRNWNQPLISLTVRNCRELVLFYYIFLISVAVVGCSHGEMDIIYAVIEEIQERHSIKIDLLLCCGDFQVCLNTFIAILY